MSDAGGNCWVFNALRKVAYREVLYFKRLGSIVAFQERCFEMAAELNDERMPELSSGEVRSITKSVACWTWEHFSVEEFTQIQSDRGRYAAEKRWAGHVKEWERLGMAKSTYYRRKAKGTL